VRKLTSISRKCTYVPRAYSAKFGRTGSAVTALSSEVANLQIYIRES